MLRELVADWSPAQHPDMRALAAEIAARLSGDARHGNILAAEGFKYHPLTFP